MDQEQLEVFVMKWLEKETSDTGNRQELRDVIVSFLCDYGLEYYLPEFKKAEGQ